MARLWGSLEGELLYHASLAPEEYRELLEDEGELLSPRLPKIKHAGGAQCGLPKCDRLLHFASVLSPENLDNLLTAPIMKLCPAGVLLDFWIIPKAN